MNMFHSIIICNRLKYR